MLTRERVSMMRKQKGITTSEMGRLLNVSQATISRYESGVVKNIPYEKLEQIATIFECSVVDLVRDDPEYDIFSDNEQYESAESLVVTSKEDIEMLKWFHGLDNQERIFLKKLFNNKDGSGEIMIIRL